MAGSKIPRQSIDSVVGSVTPGSTVANISAVLGSLLPQGGADLNTSLNDLSRQLDGLITATQAQSVVTAANTLAMTQSTATRSSGGMGSTASAIGKVASSFLGGGLAPLISGLINLFGGGGSDQPPILTPYLPPPSLHFDAANGLLDSSISGLQGVSYDQNGRPRASGSGSRTVSPPITIQVRAMDSQSFLDHSHEIASAVREAMLNMHSLNDVVSDL